MQVNAGRMLRKIARWTLLIGFCAVAAVCLSWAFQDADFSVAAEPVASEMYKTTALLTMAASVLFFALGIISFIVFGDDPLQTKKLVVMSVCAGAAVGAAYLWVFDFQRELILVSIDDVKFYDGVDGNNIIFHLQKGESADIVQCRDTKSVIEPVIRLNDGRMAYRLSGHIEIITKRTGLLSRPRYLGCGNY
ncbi:MAG TPA: hypothetical protein VK591_14945 [Xanthobacteraceae bacterium]|nr:hypothetical protein [Xanthobacteraceae bacterium]